VSAGTPVVELVGMTRRYADVVAARDVGFSVGSGELFGLIGSDGAGKTTTLRVVLGLLAPDEGTVRTCGLDPTRQRRRLSRQVGYLSQRFSLYGDLSVDENVAFFAAVHGVRGWKRRRDDLLELLRMTPFRGRQADRLSGGMKQKLALACTLIHTPALLVLDEPTTGVDPVSRRDFWGILTRLQRDGMTILLTTPYIDEAERCARVALMSASRILTVDSPERLRATRAEAMVEIIARPRRSATSVLRERPEVEDVEAFGERLHVGLRGVPAARASEHAAAMARDLGTHGIEVQAARALRPSLEDVFIASIRAAELEAPETGEV
jgi:ABC-2 type transport system ATP-binding protein